MCAYFPIPSTELLPRLNEFTQTNRAHLGELNLLVRYVRTALIAQLALSNWLC